MLLRTRARSASVLALACAPLLLAPRAASADEKLACARAGEAAQELRVSGKLIEAREKLLACARDVCPPVVRRDCAQWIGEVDGSTPTVVIRARDAEGRDLRDVRVTIDGAMVARALDGRPIALNPGDHALRYERDGATPIEEHVLLATGEKNRLLTVTFAGPKGLAKGPAARPGAPLDASSSASIAPSPPGPRTAAWIFAAVSVAAGGSFAFFGATGKSDLDHLRATCAGHCAASDVDAAWTKLIVADVSLGVGVLAAGISTWLFLKPRSAESATTGAELLPTPGGATLRWTARF